VLGLPAVLPAGLIRASFELWFLQRKLPLHIAHKTLFSLFNCVNASNLQLPASLWRVPSIAIDGRGIVAIFVGSGGSGGFGSLYGFGGCGGRTERSSASLTFKSRGRFESWTSTDRCVILLQNLFRASTRGQEILEERRTKRKEKRQRISILAVFFGLPSHIRLALVALPLDK